MTDLPHNDVVIFVRFLNNGPHLYDILEAFPQHERHYLRKKLEMYDPGLAFPTTEDGSPSYVQTLIRFWSYLDDTNKAILWTYIALRDEERNGPRREDIRPLIKKVEELKARIDSINTTFQPQQTTLF